jgi:transcriptional regulator with XRE-family HTH domain
LGQGSTKSTRSTDQMAGAADSSGVPSRRDGSGGSGVSDGLPRVALRHSPVALAWVRRQRGWTKGELARESGVAVSIITQLEHGSRSASRTALAKLARALGCPRSVLEAGQINAVATSAVSALDLLVRLLRISDPAYLARRRGFVWFGFVACDVSRHRGHREPILGHGVFGWGPGGRPVGW